MIEITDHTGRRHFVALVAISDIREITDSTTGDGILSHVRLMHGRVIQSRDDAAALAMAITHLKGQHL
ncbi:hypothetical protein ISN76_11210 [Dyella halodurans]|uniref:DUF1488 family protein n=1 Tax=Dyella halodurans TaxID=1920171 RepID=A0ABV9C3I4_9GAMM|nr:hypothetical protein [Dyella halodurans]